jgi:hypothetical protein
MAWLRYSNSNWYAFDNVNGKFSLWHVAGPNKDVDYDEIPRDEYQRLAWLSRTYPEASAYDLKEIDRVLEAVLKERS